MIPTSPLFVTVITAASIVTALAAAWGALVFAFRRRLLRAARNLSDEKRDRLQRSLARLAQRSRTLLIVSPFWMIPTAYLMAPYDGHGLSSLTTLFALVYVNLIEARLYSRSLSNSLLSNEGVAQAAA